MSHFALTIIGRDRPGIVSQVTEILYRLGCNIADSSCTILGGHVPAHVPPQLHRPGGVR